MLIGTHSTLFHLNRFGENKLNFNLIETNPIPFAISCSHSRPMKLFSRVSLVSHFTCYIFPLWLWCNALSVKRKENIFHAKCASQRIEIAMKIRASPYQHIETESLCRPVSSLFQQTTILRLDLSKYVREGEGGLWGQGEWYVQRVFATRWLATISFTRMSLSFVCLLFIPCASTFSGFSRCNSFTSAFTFQWRYKYTHSYLCCAGDAVQSDQPYPNKMF